MILKVELKISGVFVMKRCLKYISEKATIYMCLPDDYTSSKDVLDSVILYCVEFSLVPPSKHKYYPEDWPHNHFFLCP